MRTPSPSQCPPRPHPQPTVCSEITYPPWECCCLVGWQKPHLHTPVASSGGSPSNLQAHQKKWEHAHVSVTVITSSVINSIPTGPSMNHDPQQEKAEDDKQTNNQCDMLLEMRGAGVPGENPGHRTNSTQKDPLVSDVHAMN